MRSTSALYRRLAALLRGRLAVCLLLLVPLWELSAHAAIVAHVPSAHDYREAAEFVRSQLGARDLITAAPGFIDPIVREVLGDRMPLDMAGRSDLAPYERMWAIAIREALPADAPASEPALIRQFGRVRVLRWDLGASPVLFDFVRGYNTARATITRAGSVQNCPLRHGGVPRGGGLGKGALFPLRDRFDCDRAQAELSIGPVVLEDLDNRPHACLWQHPQGEDPIELTFPAVPLGEELVFYAGIYYEHERMRQGGPIEALISIAGQVRGRFVHRDGDGWRALRLPTAGLGPNAEVRVSVRAPDPRGRSFCWAASTRHADARPQP
jgi:hypothetical protein